MSLIINNIRKRSCSNCGKIGHVKNDCIEPITSLGVISFHIDGYSPDDFRMLFNDISDPNGEKIRLRSSVTNISSVQFSSPEDITIVAAFRERIRFIMVSRLHSVGMLGFVGGNYDEEDPKTIKYLFRQMLVGEIAMISRAKTFKDISCGILDQSCRTWAASSAKFTRLLTGEGLPHNLSAFIHIEPEFHTPEIGPPGGHRNNGEHDIITAKREFREETLCSDDDYTVLTTIDPLRENLTGTDHKSYRRIYYLAYMEKPVELCVNKDKDGQKHEIGQVFYCSFDQAMALIRPRHIDRKKIITQVFMFLIGRILKLERYKIEQINKISSNNIKQIEEDSSGSENDNHEPASPVENDKFQKAITTISPKNKAQITVKRANK
jgi:8-oxo-dGTP pyrophosphatase MutT (NUDIX family)